MAKSEPLKNFPSPLTDSTRANFAKSEEILEVNEVADSVEDGLDDVYYSNIEAREGYLSTLLVDE